MRVVKAAAVQLSPVLYGLVEALFSGALRELKQAGAELVEVDSLRGRAMLCDPTLLRMSSSLRAGRAARRAATMVPISYQGVVDTNLLWIPHDTSGYMHSRRTA